MIRAAMAACLAAGTLNLLTVGVWCLALGAMCLWRGDLAPWEDWGYLVLANLSMLAGCAVLSATLFAWDGAARELNRREP